MSNNSSMAFMAQQTPVAFTAPATPATTTPPPVKTEPIKEETVQVEPTKITMEELVSQLNGLGGNTELWQLTYMIHDKEFLELKEQKKKDTIPFTFNEICRANKETSRLENIANCAACRKSNNTQFSTNWTVSPTSCKTMCPSCTDDLPFCPHKLSAYIEYFCKTCGFSAKDIYRQILGENFLEKPTFAAYNDLKIAPIEYNFIDSVCATAAVELIKMNWIHLTNITEDRICYSYLPICERTKSSQINAVLDYYRCHSGKQDFLYIDNVQSQLNLNRKCTDCLFTQCPDKVAAYILYLARKYNVDALEMGEYIITNNKIKGITLRGSFRYYTNLRKLANIPFTAESQVKISNITKYIVNKFTAPDKMVPFLPFHIALYTRDEQLADETVEVLEDFLFYYSYFSGDTRPKTQEYRFSQGGLEGLLETFNNVKNPTILHIKEFDLLGTEENTNQNNALLMTRACNLINENQEKLFVVVSGEKYKLDAALNRYSDFYEGVLSYHLTIADMSIGKIVESIMQELKQNYTLEEGFATALELYVIAKYGESTLKSKAFIDNVVQTILFNHYTTELNAEAMLTIKDIPMANNRRADEDIWKDLNKLTGLETVKEEIRNIEQLLKFQKKMHGIVNTKGQRPNMHMLFTGNPGTGKTTVARLVAEILHNIGFIKQNKLVEVSSKDLIGQYIGQTAPKTAAVCQSAYGGILFVDEAYELAVNDNSRNSSFRSECISELIKQMEDNRDKLIVIFAGYTKEMMGLLQSNAGFASRIGKIIQFEDYTTEQLVDMFVRLAQDNGMRMGPGALEAVTGCIQAAKCFENFGNARYVRNLYENVIMEHAKNTVGVESPEVLVEISESDIPLI